MKNVSNVHGDFDSLVVLLYKADYDFITCFLLDPLNTVVPVTSRRLVFKINIRLSLNSCQAEQDTPF